MPYLTRKNLKLQPSPGLVTSYDIQPGNGVGLFWDTKHTPDPHGEIEAEPEPERCGKQCQKYTFVHLVPRTVCSLLRFFILFENVVHSHLGAQRFPAVKNTGMV